MLEWKLGFDFLSLLYLKSMDRTTNCDVFNTLLYNGGYEDPNGGNKCLGEQMFGLKHPSQCHKRVDI